MEAKDDIAITIMEERLNAGVDMVERLAKKKGFEIMSESVFIKGIEVGISLFIQKEQNKRFKKN